ncbi:MAG: DUF4012 domain-containing protein [Patescibacteria group bacterium]
MKHPRRRVIDLQKYKRRNQPLVVQRAERLRCGALQLKKSSAREGVRSFDLPRKRRYGPEKRIYLPEEKRSPQKISRFKVVAGAVAFVFLLNLIGVFGHGKQTIEQTISTAFSGIAELAAAAESFAAGNFAASQNRFAEAVQVLHEVEKDLLTLSGAGVVLRTQTDSVQAGSRLVSAGKLLATGGEKFAEAASMINAALANWQARQDADANGEEVESFSAQLVEPINKIQLGIVELENAAAILALVEVAALPAELADKVRLTRDQLSLFLEDLRAAESALPTLPKLLGDKVPRRYLLLFQNPDEIRPTGGFIGSVGVVTVNDGFVTGFKIRNVYEIDGQLSRHFDPPEGFGFITGNWGLRDANYHPDFPTSAEAAAWLFEQAGEGTVDGVVAVTSDVLTKLAALSDGIKLERFSKGIPAADLTLLLSLVIETKADGAVAPKQILDEVWNTLKDELTKIPRAELIGVVLAAISTKDLQFYSENPELNQFSQSFGLENSLRQTDADYLFVVNTSLSGNKSDRYCENKISHTTAIDLAGTATDELAILRTHGWSAAAEKRIEDLAQAFGISVPEDMKEILGRGRNVDLIKVFVPLGSELLEVEGIPRNRVETHESVGKTYFLFSITTQPKFSREVILRYKLPQKFTESYSFLGEFQAGDRVTAIQKSIQREGSEIFSGEISLGKEHDWNIDP